MRQFTGYPDAVPGIPTGKIIREGRILKNQILLVTDNSAGALRAGEMAIELAVLWEAPLRVAYVLDESWGSLLGDEWMSSSATRTEFYHWLEDGLVREAGNVLEGVAERAGRKGVATVDTEIIAGPTEKVIAALASSLPTRLLVLPHPDSTAPRAEAGLKYNLNALSKRVKCPLLVGPGA